MTSYRYEAVAPSGRSVVGDVEAPHEAAAVAALRLRALVPIRVEPLVNATKARLPRAELALVLRGLASLVEAGMPIERALGAIQAGPGATAVLTDVRRRLHEGAGVAEAFQAGGAVPGVVVGLLRAGERAGLALALDRAASQVERETELADRVRAALTYPAILLVTAAGAIALIATAVVPRFARLLADIGVELPVATRMLLAVADAIRHGGAWIGISAIGLAAVTWRYFESDAGRDALLASPVGGVVLGLATGRATRAMGALLSVGAPTLEALRAAAEAAGDPAVGGRIRRAMDAVRGGAPLTAALRAQRALTGPALALMAVGEQVGRLPEALLRGAELAEREATRRLDAAVRLLEPALIVGFGAVVAAVALALLQAVYAVRAT